MRSVFLAILLLPSIALAQSGNYVQGQVGGVYLVNGTQFGIYGPTGTAWRASGGHLWGDNNFNYGIEAGLGYFPHATMEEDIFFIKDTLDYSGYSADLLGVLKYTFNSGFDLFGKAGLAYLNQKSTAKSSLNSYGMDIYARHSMDGSKIGPELAIGLGYQFTPAWEASLTESTVFISNKISQNNAVATTNTLLFGLSYHF